MTNKSLLAVACATVLLAACGGGDDTPPVTAQVPADASNSTAGLVNYLSQLVVAQADTLEPVNIDEVMLQSDDTSPPSPIE